MRNMFDASDAQEIKGRLGQLGPNSVPLWGSMTAPQAVAHCAKSMEWAVGDRTPPRIFLGARILGRLIKSKVVGDDAPLRRNSPTSPDLLVKEDRDIAAERARLVALIDRFAEGGAAQCTTHPHSFFGRLTPQQWAVLMYKHLDHHLRQFGA
jgi:Protein of unknown function (DUF1569)